MKIRLRRGASSAMAGTSRHGSGIVSDNRSSN
jgi:hypothetical protein